MNDSHRLQLAESFLQESVFESRAKQAAGSALFAGSAPDGGSGSCGLGARAEVVLELSARAAELARELWPAELSSDELERVRTITREWIELQDALDRKRNHFLKDFRQRHGFDRLAYSAEQRTAFDDGLARINSDIAVRRREFAARLT